MSGIVAVEGVKGGGVSVGSRSTTAAFCLDARAFCCLLLGGCFLLADGLDFRLRRVRVGGASTLAVEWRRLDALEAAGVGSALRLGTDGGLDAL